MTSTNAKKPAFRCPTFSVPSKSKEATHEEETEKKPLPKETRVLKKPTSEGIENSTDDFAVKENEENEKNKEEPSADEVTATGDAKPLVQKKVPKKKPAFHIKAKEEETKDAGQIKKPKKVKAEKSDSEPKEKKEKLPKTAKEPKAKKEVIPKPPKEPKVKKEAQPKPPALPVRSLTDEEYVAIFTAAIESAMAIDIEEWEPKESEPMVKKLNTHSSKKAAEEVAKTTCDLQKSGQPFRPAKLENKVTLFAEEKPCVDVQKDTKKVDRTDDDHNNDDEPENSSRTGNENGAIENNNRVDTENQGDEEVDEEVDKEVDKENQGDEEVDEEVDKEVDEENQGDEEVDEGNQGDEEEDNEKIDDEARDNEVGEENEVDENNNAVHDDDEVLDQDNESIDLVQNQNETTPEGSEMNYGATPAPAPPACASPPIKKKKVSGLKKKRKLEPKSLSFQEETANTNDDKDQKEREDIVKPSAPKKKSKDTPVGDKIKKLKQMRKEGAERKEKKSLDKCTKQKKVKDEMKKEKQPPPKPAEKKRNKKKIMQHRQVANDGTWVQCCNEECLKWRYLPDVNDPAEVPERWVCNMNTREDYNSCEKAEEKYDESEHIYTKFTEGSIVWAKMTGYPWWPAMIEMDPDAETYFEAHSMTPTYYHVVFFDDKVSRSWVKVDNCKLFTGSEEDDNIKQVQVKKGPSYKKEIVNAKKNAQKALKYCLQERIELFGFAARYHGKWGNINPESIVNDLKKGSVTEKRKLKCKDEKKGKKRQRSVDLLDDDERSEDLLDDDEIESVINNTESFLDNVEDVLHSLDSQLDDSDEDSDFNPDEVLPKKSRKCERSEPEISSDTMGKLDVNSDIDSKGEIKAVDPEVEHQETEFNKDKEDLVTQEPVAQDKDIHGPLADSGKESNINYISDESDQIVPEKDQVNTNAPIKFDPEIFTMEIDDDSDVKVEKSSENKGKCDTGSAASRKRTKGKAFKAPAATEGKMKEKGSSGPKKKEKKLKSQKNVIQSDTQVNDGTDETGESELKLEGNLFPNESNQPVSDKIISSDNKLELRTAVPFISSKEKSDSKPPENNFKEDSGDEFDLSETSVLDNEAIKQISDRKSDNKLELRTAVPFISSQEKSDSKLPENNINKEDSGDEFDLTETSELDNEAIKQISDMKSDIKLELRTAVPFISSQEKTDSKLQEDKDNSMKEDSDDDFDLAETSMFDNDPVIEKVSHMEVVNVPVMQSQESDSDPFDMMEE